MIIQYSTYIKVFYTAAEESEIESLTKKFNIYCQRSKYPQLLWEAFRTGENQKYGKYVVIPGQYPVDWILKYHFPSKEVVDMTTVCWPYREVSFTCDVTPRNSIQAQAFHFLNSTESFSNLALVRERALTLQTGLGKTVSTVQHIAKSKKLAIICLHKKSLIKSWLQDCILRFTDIQEDEVAIISGKASLKKILANKDKYKIILAIDRTLYNLLTNEDTKASLVSFFKEMEIGIKVYDESHLEQKFIFALDSLTNTYETIYLTATLKRTNRVENRIFGYMMPSVKLGDENKLKRKKYHSGIFYMVDSKPANKDKLRISAGYGFGGVEYFDYILEERLEFFLAATKSIMEEQFKVNPDIKVAVVVGRLDLAKHMYAMVSEHYPAKTIGHFSSLEKNEETRLDNLKKDVIITTHKSFNAGDNSHVELIVNLIPFSSEPAIEQLIGRIRSTEGRPAIYAEIVDTGFEKATKQMRGRKKFLGTLCCSLEQVQG